MAELDQNQQDFRSAMAHLSAAVNVVTSNGPGGRTGITVSADCSVTDSPPTVLVCVNQSSYTHDIFAKNGRVCVNVLICTYVFIASVASWSTFACTVASPDRMSVLVAYVSDTVVL